MGTRTILTCAITGNLTKPEQTPHLPISPMQLIEASLEAAEAGAAAVHIHVRDPRSGAPSMDVALYGEVVEGLRRHQPELIINLTTGPGGRYVPSDNDPRTAGPGTTLLPPLRRIEHSTALRPDICSLDLNTMNSGDQVVINTPKNIRCMAAAIREAGCTPELECFDSGDLIMAPMLIGEGTLPGPGLYSFVMCVRFGLYSARVRTGKCSKRRETLKLGRDAVNELFGLLNRCLFSARMNCHATFLERPQENVKPLPQFVSHRGER